MIASEMIQTRQIQLTANEVAFLQSRLQDRIKETENQCKKNGEPMNESLAVFYDSLCDKLIALQQLAHANESNSITIKL